MQTFLPYPNFTVSAMCLDWRRLGKQRVEARQIQDTLQRGGGWERHPAVRMWDGYVCALMLYSDCMIREWVRRGYENNMSPMCTNRWDSDHVVHPSFSRDKIVMPPWLGDEELHASHRSMLMSKDPEWYSQFEWDETPGGPYKWPV